MDGTLPNKKRAWIRSTRKSLQSKRYSQIRLRTVEKSGNQGPSIVCRLKRRKFNGINDFQNASFKTKEGPELLQHSTPDRQQRHIREQRTVFHYGKIGNVTN